LARARITVPSSIEAIAMLSTREKTELKRTIEDVLKMYEPENRERLRRMALKTIPAYKVLCYINGEGPLSSNAACIGGAPDAAILRRFTVKYNLAKPTFPRSKKMRLFCLLGIDQARDFKRIVEDTAHPLVGTCKVVLHRCIAHNPVLIERRPARAEDFKLFWKRFYFDNYPRYEYDDYNHIKNLPSGRDDWSIKMKTVISVKAPEGTLVATAITLLEEIDAEGVPT
jgi:hypothetical protein